MLNEVIQIHANARRVGKSDMPEVPILLFASNGQQTRWDRQIWCTKQLEVINSVEKGKMFDLDAPRSIILIIKGLQQKLRGFWKCHSSEGTSHSYL